MGVYFNAPGAAATATPTKTSAPATIAAKTTTSKSSADFSQFAGKNVTVTAYVLNVRASGSAKAAIVGVVTKNTIFFRKR